MARAEPETMSHAEQDAPAVGPESPAGAPSAEREKEIETLMPARYAILKTFL